MGQRRVLMAAIQYDIALDVQTHEYLVRLYIPAPQVTQTLSLPVWIPGSYMVREFSRHLYGMSARQGANALSVTQLDKCTWQVNEALAGAALELEYRVYALDSSVRTAYLDAQRGFFNPTCLCLRVHGQEQQLHQLSLVQPMGAHAGSRVATAARRLSGPAQGFGSFSFAHYDDLVDTPFTFGDLWVGEFTVHGVHHCFALSGAGAGVDCDRLLRDTERICAAQQEFWRRQKNGSLSQPHFDHYVFMLHAAGDAYGGLEHANSTALLCKRSDLPQKNSGSNAKAYTTLLGLISHEYFHSWCVKRLRPVELLSYHYGQEQYTELLWFFEGFTSYYDDLFLLRAGLISTQEYLNLLLAPIRALALNPGAKVQSVARSSFDAWIKYYRPDENTPNSTVSYYTKGAMIALCLDLTLRREGVGTLDDCMRDLWSNHLLTGVSAKAVAQALQRVGGRSYDAQLEAWTQGCENLPLRELLEAAGVLWQDERMNWAQRLGLRVQEAAQGRNASVYIQTVLRGSAAEAIGLCAGDELLGVGLWRVARLEDLEHLISPSPGDEIPVLYARDQVIHHGVWRVQSIPVIASGLFVKNLDPLQQWLCPPAPNP